MEPGIEDRIGEARIAGHSWEDIDAALTMKRYEAKQAGHSDEDIDAAFGFRNAKDAEGRLSRQAKANLKASQPETKERPVSKDAYEDFVGGLQGSSAGYLIRGDLPDTIPLEHAPIARRLAHGAGEMIGDIPAMIVGGVAGGAVGGAAAGPIGAALGRGAGAFALPTFIKQEYVDGLTRGEYKDPMDFAMRQANVLWETAKSAVVGAATVGTGAVVGGALERAGAGMAESFVATRGAELAAMTGVASALALKLPTYEDVLDNAILLVAFHGAMKVPGAVSTAKKNILQHWAETGETPAEAVARAEFDPVFRQSMMIEQPKPEPAGSSVTKLEGDEFILGKNPDPEFMPRTPEQITGAQGTSSVKPPAPKPPTVFNGTIEQAREIIGRSEGEFPKESWADWIDRHWFNNYREMFNPGHSINILTERMLKGGPIPDALNPEYSQRMLEANPTISMYMIEHGMIDINGKVTGPGLKKIVEPFEGNSEMSERFRTYARSKFALEKANQGKETGVELDAAQKIVEFEELGGKTHPATDVTATAKKYNIDIADDLVPGNPNSVIGPHWAKPKPGPVSEVHMHPPGDPFYARLGMTYDQVLAHEVGHGAAFNLGTLKGFDKKTFKDLNDELTIVSRRYKPEMWEDARQRNHITKENELIADAVATWLTEPGARARMSVFQNIMKRHGIDVEKEFGVVPKELGTPVSRAFEQLVDFRNGSLKYVRDAGGVDNEGYLKMVADNASSIPGYRIDPDAKPGVKATGHTTYQSVREFLGSEKKFEPMMEAIMHETFLRVQLARQMIRDRNAYDGAASVGEAGQVTSRPMKFTLTQAEVDKIAGYGRPAGGTPPSIWRTLGHGLQHDEVPIFRDGKITAVKFEDPHLTEFLKGFDHKTMSTWQKAVAAVTDVRRSLIVNDPTFSIRNLIYDIPTQFIVGAPTKFRNTIAGSVEGVGHFLGNTKTYDAFLRSGGADKVFHTFNKDTYIQEVLRGMEDPSFTNGVWNTIKTPMHWLQAWSQFLGQSTRVGRFAQGLREGESPVTAGMAANEAAFPRPSYGGPEAKLMNSVQPFFTAYLFSLDAIVRGQLGIARPIHDPNFKSETLGDRAKNAAWFSAAAVAAITVPQMMSWYHGHEWDEKGGLKEKSWYAALAPWQKDNGVSIHLGGDGPGEGFTFFYKHPPILSFIYGAIPRRIAAAAIADDKSGVFWKGMGASLGMSFAPPGGLITYNVALPVIEHMANHSFFRGTPLVNDATRQHAMAPEAALPWGTSTAKFVSKAVNDVPLLKELSPQVIDNYMQGWIGGLGTETLKAVEGALQFTGQIKLAAPAQDLSDLPFIHSFFARNPSFSSQPIKDWREKMTSYDQVHGSLSRLWQEGDLERFTKLAKENPTAAALHDYKMTGFAGVLAGGQENKDEFIAVLKAAQEAVPKEHLIKLRETSEVVKMLSGYAKLINAAETPKIRAEAEKIIPTDKPRDGPLTPNDKKQILDRTYAWMQRIAQDGMKFIEENKLK